jgi:lysophosphatidylglycerol acyltransferase 1
MQYWKPELYHSIEGTVYNWMQQNVAYWLWSAGYTIVEVGTDLRDCINDECIVVANHQTTADVPILMSILSNANKSNLGRNAYWIMDHIFRFVPFGWVSLVHGDFFIRQGRDTRRSQLDILRKHLRDVYVKLNRTWILLFPEGGFLHKRLHTSQEYARKHGYPVLKHVTLPRVGALQTILDELPPASDSLSFNGFCGDTLRSSSSVKKTNTKAIKWIIDLTIGYPSRQPLDLLQIWFGHRPPCQTVVHYRRYCAADVPRDEAGLLKWLYARWAEKDQLLDCFYRTGEFPVADGDHCGQPRLLALDDQWCPQSLTMFIVAMWVNVKLVCATLALAWGLVGQAVAM